MTAPSDLRAPFPWFGDAMAYAKEHVKAGVLRVDADGSIWRCKRSRGHGRWVNVTPRRAENVGGKGYLRISLHVPARPGRLAIVMAHNLVYETLVGRIPDELEINHIDLNKKNNRPDNLEPLTGAQNVQHSYDNGRTKPWSQSTIWRGRPMLTDEQIAEARALRNSGALIREIASRFGISLTHAHRITPKELECRKE